VAAQAVKLAAHISDNSLGILSFLFDFDLGGGKGISLFALGVAGGGSLLGGGFGPAWVWVWGGGGAGAGGGCGGGGPPCHSPASIANTAAAASGRQCLINHMGMISLSFFTKLHMV
jgi:hypothetical protein